MTWSILSGLLPEWVTRSLELRSWIGFIFLLNIPLIGCYQRESWETNRPSLQSVVYLLLSCPPSATDILRQHEFLTRFKGYLDEGGIEMASAPRRHFVLQMALKCADISNPCRPWQQSKKWAEKVTEEFFQQGDFERETAPEITKLCDRYFLFTFWPDD